MIASILGFLFTLVIIIVAIAAIMLFFTFLALRFSGNCTGVKDYYHQVRYFARDNER